MFICMMFCWYLVIISSKSHFNLPVFNPSYVLAPVLEFLFFALFFFLKRILSHLILQQLCKLGILEMETLV